MPDISVVIPTRLRETRLAFLLEALAGQSLDRQRFEVIVVRAPDGLEPPLAEAPQGLSVRFLVAGSPGAAAQRNVGWREARSRFIAFTDDDCRPAPEWLERLLGACKREDTIVQGRTESDPDERHLLQGFARSMEVTELDAWAPTCNIVYSRALLEGLDGFDERFPGAWGEDTDLALRAHEAGAAQEFIEAALVWHAVHPRSFVGAAREALKRSNISIVLSRHPEQRGTLFLGLFVRRTHASLLGGATAAFLLRRLGPVAMLALVPYVNSYFDRSRIGPRGIPRFMLVFMPRRAAMEGIEMAGLLAASIKYRSPVL